MMRSRALTILMVVGIIMGLATLGLAWKATSVGAGGVSGSLLSVETTGSAATWTAQFDPGVVDKRRVYLQVRTIPTTMTQTADGQNVPVVNWVDAATWQTLSIADPNRDGIATFRLDHPLGVEHSYRALVNPGGAEVTTNTVTYAAPLLTRSTGLATIHLFTNDGAPIDSTADAWEGQVSLQAGTAGDCPAGAPVRAKLSGRGNSTWTFDKQPYNITLDKAASLCGMASAKKWALLAEHYDRSLLRTTVAMHIGQGMSGLAWTPHAVPVDVHVNGEYLGLYTLIERVDINPARIAVDELKNDQTDPPTDWNASPTITGGYLMEWDFRDDGTYHFNVGPHGAISVLSPADGADGTAITTQQLAYIKDYLTKADAALYGAQFTNPESGWRAYIDEKSAVDYYIAMEYTKTLDGNMYTSSFFYKARDSATGPGKLHLGPIWDFDTSMGDALYPAGQGLPTGWYARNVDPLVEAKQTVKTWFNRLNEDPGFRAAVAKRWKELRPLFTGLPAFVDTRASLIAKGAESNFSVWDVTERLEVEQVIKGSWTAEVDHLKTWLSQRTAWVSKQLG